MKKLAPEKGLFSIRPLLLIGVMLTLCTSEGVGLQLLPMPSEVDEQSLLQKSAHIGIVASSAPLPLQDKSIPGRVVIAAPKQARPLAQQHILKVVIALPIIAIEFQDGSLQKACPEHAQPVYSLILSSQPAGRGPPALA